MKTAPRVFAVILNYQRPEDTLRCLASVRDSRSRPHAVVVDNASGNGSVDALRRALPATPLIASPENLGYAGGNNLGITYALEHGADFVWLLNDDAAVEPDTLDRLMETMTLYPNAGIVGARILYGGRATSAIYFNGARLDWSRGGAASHVDMGSRDEDVPDLQVRSTDYVNGACMLVRGEVFEDIGLLPERFFMYFEETTFNVRAHRRGWQLLVNPRARAYHHQRASDVPSVHYVYYYARNRILYAQEFCDFDVDALIRDFEPSIDDWWRSRFRAAHPEWIPAFELIVTMALDDARAGRDGKREEVTSLTWEAAARG